MLSDRELRNRRLLLQLYNSLIRSQLDYGAPIYSHTNNTSIKLVDAIPSAIAPRQGLAPTVSLSISHRQLSSIRGPVPSNSYLSALFLPSKLSSSLLRIPAKQTSQIRTTSSYLFILPALQAIHLDLAALPRSPNS